MEVEGKGKRAPRQKLLPVESGVVAACVEWARQCADYRDYQNGSQWQRGLKPAMTLYGGHRAESYYSGLAIGKVAEWYVAQMFGVTLDLRFLPGGDGGIDLTLPCGPTQVKNCGRRAMLIKLGSRELRTAEWFIATGWNGADDHLPVLGYAHRQRVTSSQVEPGIGKWMNYVVPLDCLEPVSSLLSIRQIQEVV